MATTINEAERSLVIRAQGGDRGAFGSLVERHMRRAYFAALGLVGSEDDAMDLSQEAFARAFRARESIDPDRPFYGWLYTILRNLCFNFLRDRRSRHQKLAEAHGWMVEDATLRASMLSPESQAAAEEMRQLLLRSIERLPDREREMLLLKEFEGLKYREIADLLLIPIGTVMSRLYAARKRLAGILEVER